MGHRGSRETRSGDLGRAARGGVRDALQAEGDAALPDAERALAWPVRSGKLVLKLALDRVAGFYRIG